jgi:predicted MFS family arabinose efflux permease
MAIPSSPNSTAPAQTQTLPRGFPGYIALLRDNKDVRNIWIAQVISQLGDWFNSVAILGLINRLTPDPMLPALVTVFTVLPAALSGLTISGLVVDRVDRKKLALTMDFARFGIALLPLFVSDVSTLWIAFIAITLISICDSLFMPALSAAQPNLCRPHELAAANALQQSTWASVSMVGAALGGLVASTFGPQVAFIANAVSYLGSAFFLMQVRGRFSSANSPRAANSLRALTEGFRFLKAHARVLAFVLIKFIWALSFAAAGLFSVYSYQVYGAGDLGTSWLMAARGIGSFLGPLLLQAAFVPQTPRQYAWVTAGALALCIFGYGLWAFTLVPIIGALGIFIGHLGGGNVWTFSRIFVQKETPDHIRGRVLALDAVGFTLGTGVFAYIIGQVASQSSPMYGVLTGIGATLFFGIIWFGYMVRKVILAKA